MSNTQQLHPVRCKFFRVKGPVMGTLAGGEAGLAESLEHMAQCWCVKTQGPFAPDRGFVDPHGCVAGRRCFVDP